MYIKSFKNMADALKYQNDYNISSAIFVLAADSRIVMWYK